MRCIRTRLFAFLAVVCAAAPAQPSVPPTAHPLLWRIDGETPHYLYGTIHLSDPRVVELPDPVHDALDRCAILLTELEFTGKTQRMMMAATRLPAGQTLQDVLSPSAYARLEAYLARKKFPIAGMQSMRPWVVTTTLVLLDDIKTMLSGKALDMVLVDEAKERGKETAALETVEEQVGVFEALSTAEQEEMLVATLTMLEEAEAKGTKPLRQLLETYLGGDVDELQAVMDELSGLEAEHRALADKLEKLLLVDRNHRMTDRIVERIRADAAPSHFFAVGAGHYPGKDGILALLAARGFTVTRIAPPDPLTSLQRAVRRLGERLERIEERLEAVEKR